MDFINKAKDKITKTSTDVAKRAKDLTDMAKYTSQITNNENTIKVTYTEIGKYAYENLRDQFPADINEKAAVVDAAMAEIDDLKKEILKLKGNVKCEQCEREVPDNFPFCPYCGQKMPEPVVDIIDEEEVKEVEIEEAQEEEAEKTE